jgi:hypothetical protein
MRVFGGLTVGGRRYVAADGTIILGGPLSDGARTLHVVEAADEPAVRPG